MSAPLDPVEAEARRGSAELTEKQKRDLLSTRLFEPGGRHQDSIRVETPEPTGQQIANLLSRLTDWLDREFGVVIPDHILGAVATSESPWRELENQLKRAGVGVEFSQVQESITELHEDQFRISHALDISRSIGGANLTGEPTTDDAAMYLAELNRLTTKGDLSEQQAHRLLAEWGWQNPVIRGEAAGFDTSILEELAEGLAVMKATGEYTGPVDPADLLTMNSVEAAFELLGEDYAGSLTRSQFEAVLSTETGLGDTIDENRQLAAESAAGRPTLDVTVAPDSRGFIGVHPDFVARAEPRPPGPLRGTTTQAGLDFGDAQAVAASGPRGSDLAFAGRAGITQDPEYREGDNYNIFNGLSFEQTMLYQTMLVDAGWLSADDFAIEQGQANGGFETWAAMEKAMVAANRTIASSWIEAAQISAEARERNEAAAAGTGKEPVPVWTPGTYLAPDPDRLSQIVKTAFRSQLGREPTAQEVQGLMASLSGEFGAQFAVSEQVDKAAFEQSIAATEASLGPIDPQTGERAVEPLEEGETFRTVDNPLSSVTGVDPISSFQELFEARFAEEMSRNRQRVTQRDARSDIMSSIFAIDSAVGGGR
jgi:hypothetical protein